MESNNVYSEILLIAKKEQEEIEKIIPEDPILCFILLTEMTRVYDYYGLSFLDQKDSKMPGQYLDVFKYGWNLATSYFLKPLDVVGFPIVQSTEDTRRDAVSILYKCGCVFLLHRVSEMVRTGLLIAEKKESGYDFRKSDLANSQFLDIMEFSYLEKLEKIINSSESKHYNDWELVKRKDLKEAFFKPGNFLSLDEENFSSFLLPNIDAEMNELVRPWDSGHGIMMAYDTTPEVDNHFLAIATELVLEWRNDAGLHPQANIDGVKGSELCAIVILIVSFHLKHVHFAALASKKHPEINIPQSLTIWAPLKQLINDVSEFGRLDIKLVTRVFDLIMLKSQDVPFLKTHTSMFMPLIIDMGNGFILRPVSSLLQNPFFQYYLFLKTEILM